MRLRLVLVCRARGVATLFCALALIGAVESAPAHLFAAHSALFHEKLDGEVSRVSIRVAASPYYAGTLGAENGHLVIGDETGGISCRIASVDPVSLKILSSEATSCDNPELSAESAEPIESVPHPDAQEGMVRISTFDQRTKSFHVGPVVLRYGNFSDTRPEWTYGDHSLWIFDADGFTNGTVKTGRAVLLRVSLSSGSVLSRFNLPSMSRVVLAADEDGLWFGLTVESRRSGKKPGTLYFLGNSSKRAVVVSSKGLFVGWLVASGHVAQAYFVDASLNNSGQVDTFGEAHAVTKVVRIGANTTVPREIGEEDFDAEPVLIAQGYGLIFMWPLYNATDSARKALQQVFLFDPSTGKESRIAMIPTLPFQPFQPNIVYHGSLYLLVGGKSGVNSVTLYRVALTI
jgi:hypothetical protein